MTNRQRKTAALVLTMLTGFFMGTAVPEALRMGTGSYAGFSSLYSFQKYGTAAVVAGDILPYIMAVRLKTLLFLWMSSYTMLGIALHFAYAWWLAASAGMLLSLFVLRDGYEGILLFLCCLFPQWILYAAVWKQELEFLFGKRRRRIPEEALDMAGASMDLNAAARGYYRRSYKWELANLGKMVGFCILGCLSEAFLGTWTIKIFLQFFT